MDPQTSGPNNRPRRRSSIFPLYLRRKGPRKDSTFASESTTTLWPFALEENPPTLFAYQDGEAKLASGFKFGWVNGVYIRTVLNIWGVMLFLRMGWITGHAGIVVSLLIILLSSLVTICTTLSMSAICTNGEVGTGGIYYMISRSLGAEAGSMIGVIFSFANAVLVSLNLVGAAETTVNILAIFDFELLDPLNDVRIYATILLIIVAIIPLIGMDWEAKAMFVLMIILLVGLCNYLVGTFLPLTEDKIAKGVVGWEGYAFTENLWPKFSESVGFAEIFAVFFPSVIGIFAGASMSGDLRNPNEAIPKGTFLAITTTSSVYILLIICLGFTILPHASGDYEEMANLTAEDTLLCSQNRTCKFGLIADYQTMTLGSAFGPIIYAGIYAATISSALGSYVCSPRIFQALCEDKLFPYIYFFSKGYGKNNDPRRGYVLTFLIALIFIVIGELNLIAPIISNFFMASFCLVNMACFYSSFVSSPSFRPTFKYYNQWVSLLTGLTCVGIMFFLDWISALATVLIMGIIYLYISHKKPDVNWGSSTRGHVYNNALSSALKLNYVQDHVKNFRPSILLLTGNPSARIPLVEFANTITKNRSLLIIGHITNFDIPYEIREKVINAQYDWMLKRKIKAFYHLLEAPSLENGAKTMMQVSGLGRKLAPNIVMLGYKSSWRNCIMDDLHDYYAVLLRAMDMSMGICVLRLQEGLDYADFLGQTFQSPDSPSAISQLSADTVTSINMTPTIPEIFEFAENEDNVNYTNSDDSTKVRFDFSKINNIPNGGGAFSNRNDRFKRVKSLIPHDAIDAINQFNQKQKNGSIDIWWLIEDGGLTILIPYLLHINYLWGDCPIRVFCVANNKEDVEKTQCNMEELLNRLRIPYAEVRAYSELDIEPSDQSKERFRNFIGSFFAKGEIAKKGKITKSDLAQFQVKTSRFLRIRDLLEIHSKSATLIVMTMPMPHKEIMPFLFMSWLETISQDMPPFLFVRGHKSAISV